MLPYKCFTAVDLKDQQQHVGTSATDLENQLPEAKKYNMYCRASLGKISSHNFQNILDSIKHLLKQAAENKEDDLKSFIKPKFLKLMSDQADDFQPQADFEWIGSVALGLYIGNNGKFELEIAHSQGAIENSKKMSTYIIIPNLYCSPSIKDTPVIPHVGIGVGLIGVKLTSHNPPLNIVYQIKLGVSYCFESKMRAFLDYRYFNTPLPLVDRVINHNIELGVSFDF